MSASPVRVERWTKASLASVVAVTLLILALAVGPRFFSDNAIDKLTTLFVYVILATMWNALAGYAGLVSIGQQAYFGLGADLAVRLADGGVPVYTALASAAALTGLISWPDNPILYCVCATASSPSACGSSPSSSILWSTSTP